MHTVLSYWTLELSTVRPVSSWANLDMSAEGCFACGTGLSIYNCILARVGAAGSCICPGILQVLMADQYAPCQSGAGLIAQQASMQS